MRRLRLIVLAALVAAAPAAARATDWSTARKVTVAMVEYAFRPDKLSFRQGVAYRLRLDNRGKETHEFTAADFFKAIDLRDAKPLNADRTEIVVQPGQHKDLYFVAKQAGSYKLICSDHDWAGMVGEITISP
ncbi:MAG TPA: cupredoxin domain-containing protein [Stellaceae bacterium]|nr:cupredoxin domain-containing protein [Stellaceae bacterium]